MRVIAIDGPAGSGKSTVARALARRLGLDYLDTGAMYRAVTFAALRRGIDPEDVERVAALAERVDLRVDDEGVVVDGVDATVEIRGPEVTSAVSMVAANVAVRAELRRRQIELAKDHGGGVIEGRDIGTVVFPDAELKVYLTADPDVRARRRHKEVRDMAYDQVASAIAERDAWDQGRVSGPLVVADDGAGSSIRTPRGGVLIRPNDFNPERVILNDLIAGGPTLPAANVGDRLPGATVGVMDYSFGNFKLEVISLPTMVSGGLTPEVTQAPAEGELAVATFSERSPPAPVWVIVELARLASASWVTNAESLRPD